MSTISRFLAGYFDFGAELLVIKNTDASMISAAIPSLEVSCSLANAQPRITATTEYFSYKKQE